MGKVTLQSGNTIGETMSKLVVDNYGLPKNYKNYVQQSFGETNQLGQQFLRIVQKSQTLSGDERKVLYGMITGEVEDLPQLVGFSREARDVIKRTGQEMVDAGLLSEKVFQKNVDTYLHRSYLKHLKNKNSEGYQNALQFKVIGDELKPRGAKPITITQKVYEQSFNPANKTYNRYSDYEVFNTFKGTAQTKQITLKSFRDAEFGEKLGRKNKYKGFEKDITKGKNGLTTKNGVNYVNLIKEKPMVTLRRDWTKAERKALGEIEDASFAIAETGRLMTNDLAVYKLYSKISNDNELSLTSKQYDLLVTEGKIKSEKLVNHLLDDNIKGTFQMCFQEYMKRCGSVLWKTHQLSLDNAWINDMYAGEYNPCHFHASKNSLVGLSSVLFLKTPDSYGKEIVNHDSPSNGHLEFIGGQQHSLAISQFRLSPTVGDFFVFPYTLVHGVYPFSDTDQVRRTLSYNCDILPKVLVKTK